MYKQQIELTPCVKRSLIRVLKQWKILKRLPQKVVAVDYERLILTISEFDLGNSMGGSENSVQLNRYFFC